MLAREKVTLGRQIITPLITIVFKIGACVLALMMLLTAVDVTMRYIFNRPIIGSFEITEYMMVILVSFGFAYVTLTKGQISVDLLITNLPPKARIIMGLFTDFVSFAILTLLTWQVYLQVKSQYDSNAISASLEIPAYPFVAAGAFGLTLLSIALLLEFIEDLKKAGIR
jgi:TRAP-type transport system small permease protein